MQIQYRPPPLSEIQIIDTLHWTVEVDAKNAGFYSIKKPFSTDTFTLNCYTPRSWYDTSYRDSMRSCVIPEQADSSGIILLTPQHFPNLKLRKGCIVVLGMKKQTSYYQEANIPLTLPSQSSLIFINTGIWCNPYYLGGCYGSKIILNYKEKDCPSLGTMNSDAVGSISGKIMRKDSIPMKGVIVHSTNSKDTSTTDSLGQYNLYGFDTCHTYFLTITNSLGRKIADTVIGPLKVTMRKTLTTNVLFPRLNITAVLPSTKLLPTHRDLRFLPSTNGNIILTISGTTSGIGIIDIFSTTGKKIRELPFKWNDSGTYSIRWDGNSGQGKPVGMGNYICRLQIDRETLCSGTIVKSQ